MSSTKPFLFSFFLVACGSASAVPGPAGTTGAIGATGPTGASSTELPTIRFATRDTFVSTLAGITDASVTKQYTVMLAAGTYEVGDSLVLPAFVSLTGTAQSRTQIIGTGEITLATSGSSTLRDLTIINTRTSGVGTALSSSGSLVLERVTLESTQAASTFAARISGALDATDVTFIASSAVSQAAAVETTGAQTHTFSRCSFDVVSSGTGGASGVIGSDGSVNVILDSVIDVHTQSDGGKSVAVQATGGELTIERSSLSSRGGASTAIRVLDASQCLVSIRRSTLVASGNALATTFAIYIAGGTTLVVDDSEVRSAHFAIHIDASVATINRGKLVGSPNTSGGFPTCNSVVGDNYLPASCG